MTEAELKNHLDNAEKSPKQIAAARWRNQAEHEGFAHLVSIANHPQPEC